MNQEFQTLSVIDVAEICGIARSTVYYWIAQKSLPTLRQGNKQMVFVNDLVLFLRSEGQSVPKALLEQVGGVYSVFRPLKRCWEFWAKDAHAEKCRECNVFTCQIEACFTARKSQTGQSSKACHNCRYFGDYYGPQTAFVHQIERPAAIYKDLYLWAGNKGWAELCGIEINQLSGAGIEEFLHSESLGMFINYDKRRQQRDPAVPDRYEVFFRNQQGAKIAVRLWISPLVKPAATWLALVDATP